MAKITNTQSGQEFLLLPVHLFGRHAIYPNTALEGNNISRQHAVVSWDGEHWLLTDISSNGTRLQNQRIEKNTKNILKQGDEINFGSLDSWKITDDAPPSCMLIPHDSKASIIELTTTTHLPSKQNPEFTLFMSDSGEWVCQGSHGLTLLIHGVKIGNKEHQWLFVDARAHCVTYQLKEHNSADRDRVNDNARNDLDTQIEEASVEELFAAVLDISLYLYCCGIARQTSKNSNNSIIKPLCKKDGGRPYDTIDINIWKAWIAGKVQSPQPDKVALFSAYLLKQFPIIYTWLGKKITRHPSSPLAPTERILLIRGAKYLHRRPEEALITWKEQNAHQRIVHKFNTLPSEIQNQACFEWLTHYTEWTCPVDVPS
jgi:FHA domain